MVKGAWISVSYTSSIVVPDGKGKYKQSPDQRVFAQDQEFSVQVNLTGTNVGTNVAYNVNFTVILSENVAILTKQLDPQLAYNLTQIGSDDVLILNPVCDLAPGDRDTEILYLTYKKSGKRLLQTGTLTFFKSVSAQIDLTATTIQVTQTIPTPLTFTISTLARDTVVFDQNTITADTAGNLLIILHVTAYTSVCKDPRFMFYYSTVNLVCVDNATDPLGNCSKTFFSTNTMIRAVSPASTLYNNPIPYYFKGELKSATFNYTVEVYDDQMNLLATNFWLFNYAETAKATNANNQNNQYSNNTCLTCNQTQTNGTNITIANNTGNSTNITNGTIIQIYSTTQDNTFPLWATILIPIVAVTLIIILGIIVSKDVERK